jgi:hypothetical protein
MMSNALGAERDARIGSSAEVLHDIRTHAPGALPLTEDRLRNAPSGDVGALSQNVSMGWDPVDLMGCWCRRWLRWGMLS